jgi:hypothetical protein
MDLPPLDASLAERLPGSMAKAGEGTMVKGGKEIVGYYKELRRTCGLLCPAYTRIYNAKRATNWALVTQLPTNTKRWAPPHLPTCWT